MNQARSLKIHVSRSNLRSKNGTPVSTAPLSIRESKSVSVIEPVMKPGSKKIELKEPKQYLYKIKEKQFSESQ